MSGTAMAVHYTGRGSLDQSQEGTSGTARLAPGGLLVMAAGALVTPRLLLLSGVGPRGREAVRQLLARGHAAGVLPERIEPEFVN